MHPLLISSIDTEPGADVDPHMPSKNFEGASDKKSGGVPLQDAPLGWGVLTNQGKLDLSYEVQTRGEGI